MTAADPALVPILMFHSVAETAGRIDLPFTVRPDDLRRHVDALADWGARTITVADYAAALRAHTPLEPRTVVLTVDDGYADTADCLAPVLAGAGFTATVFVTTGSIGSSVRGSRMITWPQIRDLHAAGFEVGAHSHHHVALDIVPAARAYDEMARSRRMLEDGLSSAVTSFAYPHGYWTPQLTRLAARAGLLAACAAKDGLSHPGDDLYALARIVVGRRMRTDHLLEIVDGHRQGVRTSARTAQRAAWRLARWTAAAVRTGVGEPPAERGAPAPSSDLTAGLYRTVEE